MTACLFAGAVVALVACLRWALRGGRRATVLRRFPYAVAPARRACRLPRPPEPAARAMLQAGCSRPERAWSAWLALAVVAPATAAVTSGPSLAAVTGVMAVLGPAGFLHARRDRAALMVEQGLPPLLEAVARSLRSGTSLRQALEEVAPRAPGRLGAEVRRMVDDLGRGATFSSACDALAGRMPVPGVRLAVTALALANDSGGAPAKALDGVASTLRERQATTEEVRALATQALASAFVIGLAPLAFGAFAAATDARTSHFLLHTTAGLVFLTTGLVLDGVGWMWMQRLCRVTR